MIIEGFTFNNLYDNLTLQDTGLFADELSYMIVEEREDDELSNGEEREEQVLQSFYDILNDELLYIVIKQTYALVYHDKELLNFSLVSGDEFNFVNKETIPDYSE